MVHGSLRSLPLQLGTLIGLGLGLILGVGLSHGTECSTNVSEYAIDIWQLEQGLPHISVTSIAQTLDGYLWVGTFNGLARFDGVRFTIFTDHNTPALDNSAITYLHTDAQGALWIVTHTGGLVRMAAGQFTTVLKDNAQLLLAGGDGSEDSPPRLVLRNRDGIWHTIEDNRVQRVDGMQAKDAPQFLFENTCLSWIAHRGAINHSYEVALPVLTSEGSNRTAIMVSSATASRTGGYWVATSNGLYRLQQGRLSPRVATLPLPVPPKFQLPMKEDGQGTLWASSWGAGLFRLDADGSWQQFRTGAGLADNFVNCLFRDREGSLWVGTGQGGLHRVRRRVFQTHHTANGPDVVMSVTQDRQGRMWFGVNGGGLHTVEDGTLKPVTEPASLRTNRLTYSVLADSQNAVWIGLYGVAALRWHADAVTRLDLGEGSMLEMTPHALFEDVSGTVWLGCAHGLLRYESGRFRRYTSQQGLSCETVTALAEDRSGTLYIGTDGGGLNCLREGRFTCFSEQDGLADNHVVSLYVDKEDTIWMGTVNGGLCRFKDGRFASASVKDGLPTDSIGTLVEDDLGNLWLGCNRGIIRASRRALNEYLDGMRSSVAWRVFDRSEGLSTLGCGGGGQPASCKSQDGRLWFCTIKGVAVVDPRQIPVNPLPPPVVIEEVVLDDKSVASRQWSATESRKSVASSPSSPAKGPERASIDLGPLATQSSTPLTVPPRTHRVEFRFTGLSLVASEEARFRYRLDGYDHDWVEAGKRRTAYYTEIPPGRYHFHVTACNNDGVWNDTGAMVGLHVLPPWWQTWWVRMLAALGLCGAVFGWYEGRLRHLQRERVAQECFSRQLIASQENERQRLAGELHDGLGQDLLVIASQAQLSLSRNEDPPSTAARLKDIAETAKQALQQTRHMAHNLRPGLLVELGFTKAIQATLTRAAQASGITIAAALEDVDGLLSPEFEVNLFRITQEALNNVLKHAGASDAKVTLTKQPSALCLVVEDNGRGFEASRLESASPDRRGFGLRQIAERAKMMGGQLDLDAQPGQGTRLTVVVPLHGSRVHL